MSGTMLSAPRCFIDVYPYEGGQFTVSGNDAAFLGVSVTKSIGQGGDGNFQLTLAPGGPRGVNSRPSWLDIFTPFSLVVIGMRRAGVSNIVMIGVVTSIAESMNRAPGQSPQREIRVIGSDFTALFKYYCYYNLAFNIGFGTGPLGPLGLPTELGAGLSGSPAFVGMQWYNNVMTGTKGLLHSTSFAYKGARPLFENLMSVWFEEYPTKVKIPTFAPFIGDQGSWLDKFLSFFPFPWYEVFIQTSPFGFYSPATEAQNPISMDGFPNASPTLVARVNPLPFLTANGNPTAPAFKLDMTRWNALPIYYVDGNHGAISQELNYSQEEVKNYYIFMPTWLATQVGSQNGSISPFQLLFSAWADAASVNRYGYRPQISEVRWMADPTGSAAQAFVANNYGSADMEELVGTLSLQMPAYCEPTPNMLSGPMTMELRPDIIPGNRFAFAPYRDGVQWTFYISAVSHSMAFGSRATTTLSLTRGLPTSVYQDNALMLALCTGNAMRQNGQIVAGLPPGSGSGLAPLNIATLQSIMASPSHSFAAPR